MTKNDYTKFYIYTFKISPDTLPYLICYNSNITKNKIILFYIYSNVNLIKAFALNYNVLSIMNGIGGLAYSN